MNEKENSRPPTANEKELIAYLLKKAVLPLEYLESMTVTSMNDGGMGSLKIHTSHSGQIDTKSIYIASEIEFKDRDGMVVLASLYVSNNVPYELDMMKMDFSPLLDLSNWKKFK